MKISIIIAFTLLAFTINAQRPHGKMPGNSSKDGNLIGRVLENKSLNPIEYANVALYSLRDSSLVNGTITDKRGWFSLNELSYGRYYIEVKFIGFDKFVSDVFMITPKNKSVTLAEIKLRTSANQLAEVEVVEQRNYIEYKLDKKIINVSQDLTSIGGTAADVLENTPSVETDIDGNVSLRGSSDFLVLIDGKPSIFEGSDALQQIPASTIEKIEIITNPSAKYDPDGVSGIINVITKKNVLKGINGIANVSIGTRNRYSGDVTLSYKTNKLNIYGGINYTDKTRYGYGSSERTIYDTAANMYKSIISESDRNRTRYRQSIKLGLDYSLNPSSTLTLSGSLGKMGYERRNSSNNHDFTDPISISEFYIGDNNFELFRNYYRINADYSKKFADSGHKLDISIYQSFDNGENDEILDEFITTSDWNTILSSSLQQKGFKTSKGKETRFKTDYVKPINEGKFESGYQLRYESDNETYELKKYNLALNYWEQLSEFNNDLDYKRYIQSIYFIYSGKVGILNYQTGLRNEYTNRIIKQNISNQSYPIKRLDWFPSLHVSLDLSDKNQVQASYGRRVHRPRSWYLDPLVRYVDNTSIRYGNPLLEPEFIDSYELNFQRKFGKSFVSVESYFRQTNNKIYRERDFKNNLYVFTFSNLDRDYSLGFEIMANLQIFKWWRLNATTNLFKYQVEGNIEGTDLVQNTNTWGLRLNSSFMLKTKTRIQISGYYSGPSVTIDGKRDGFYFTNIGVKQDFLDRKASVTLQVRDIFGTMSHTFTSERENFYMNNEFRGEPRVLTLQFTYIINNYKKRERYGERGEMEFDNGDM